MRKEQGSNMSAAMEEFIASRVCDCGRQSNPALEKAWADLRDCAARLEAVLPEKHKALFRECENACSLVDGETQNCFYRAGFSDAMAFVFGWRDRKWN